MGEIYLSPSLKAHFATQKVSCEMHILARCKMQPLGIALSQGVTSAKIFASHFSPCEIVFKANIKVQPLGIGF